MKNKKLKKLKKNKNRFKVFFDENKNVCDIRNNKGFVPSFEHISSLYNWCEIIMNGKSAYEFYVEIIKDDIEEKSLTKHCKLKKSLKVSSADFEKLKNLN